MKRNCKECRKLSKLYCQQAARSITRAARRGVGLRNSIEKIVRKLDDDGTAPLCRYKVYRGPS